MYNGRFHFYIFILFLLSLQIGFSKVDPILGIENNQGTTQISLSLNDSSLVVFRDYNGNESGVFISATMTDGSSFLSPQLNITGVGDASYLPFPFITQSFNSSSWILFADPNLRWGFKNKTYDYQIVVQDSGLASNITTLSFQVIANNDSTPPIINFKITGSKKEDGSYDLTQGSVIFEITVKDNVYPYLVYLNYSDQSKVFSTPPHNEIPQNFTISPNREYVWTNASTTIVWFNLTKDDLSFGLQEGNYSYSIVAEDLSGNIAKSSELIHIYNDNRGPRITLLKEDRVYKPDNISLQWNYEDLNPSNPITVDILVDSDGDGSEDTVLLDGVTSSSLTVSMPDGWTVPPDIPQANKDLGFYPYRFLILAEDKFGNRASFATTVKIDISGKLGQPSQSSLEETDTSKIQTTIQIQDTENSSRTSPSLSPAVAMGLFGGGITLALIALRVIEAKLKNEQVAKLKSAKRKRG